VPGRGGGNFFFGENCRPDFSPGGFRFSGHLRCIASGSDARYARAMTFTSGCLRPSSRGAPFAAFSGIPPISPEILP
jgi:hypothetical protein